MDYNLSVSTAIIAISSCIFNLRKIEPQNPKLLELRVKSITEQKRMSRDQRKALLKEKKEKSQAEALLSAVKVTGVLCSSKPLALIARLILTLVSVDFCQGEGGPGGGGLPHKKGRGRGRDAPRAPRIFEW